MIHDVRRVQGAWGIEEQTWPSFRRVGFVRVEFVDAERRRPCVHLNMDITDVRPHGVSLYLPFGQV